MSQHEDDQLSRKVLLLEEEITVLRRRLQDAPRRVRLVEERLLESRGKIAQAAGQNEKLAAALEETREQLALLREEVEMCEAVEAACKYAALAATRAGTRDAYVDRATFEAAFPEE